MTNRSTRPASHPEAGEPAIPRLSLRTPAAGADPDHHLWRNGRLWWIAFTVHRGPFQERLRFSLRTDDVAVARRKRDEIFALYEEAARAGIAIRPGLPDDGERRFPILAGDAPERRGLAVTLGAALEAHPNGRGLRHLGASSRGDERLHERHVERARVHGGDAEGRVGDHDGNGTRWTGARSIARW